MFKTISNISRYIDFLNHTLKLNVSFHFKHGLWRSLPEQVAASILPYQSHTNPYCMMIKNSGHHKECMNAQVEIIKNCKAREGMMHTCYAGVYQYIYPIFKKAETVGFIAASGYRNSLPPASNISIWKKHLNKGEFPFETCEAVIPPLAVTIEYFLENYQSDSKSEYNMILQYLNDNHTNITVADLCKHFSRSKSHISHMFKSKCGMSVREYCNNLKLEDAKRFIQTTDFSITEIAYEVGFSDVSYFISLFKKKYSLTPLQYKKLNKM